MSQSQWIALYGAGWASEVSPRRCSIAAQCEPRGDVVAGRPPLDNAHISRSGGVAVRAAAARRFLCSVLPTRGISLRQRLAASVRDNPVRHLALRCCTPDPCAGCATSNGANPRKAQPFLPLSASDVNASARRSRHDVGHDAGHPTLVPHVPLRSRKSADVRVPISGQFYCRRWST